MYFFFIIYTTFPLLGSLYQHQGREEVVASSPKTDTNVTVFKTNKWGKSFEKIK